MNLPEQTEERLTRALRDAEEKGRVFIPPTLDEAILKQARKRFQVEAKAKTIFTWRRGLAFAGAAVVVTALVFTMPRKQPFAREDINRDGRVDILDAFALAKAIDSHDAKLDLNGDGKVDDEDVRAIAMDVVRLDRKPGS